MCIVWDGGQVLFFPIRISNIENTVFPPLLCISTFNVMQVSKCIWVSFWTLQFIILALMPYRLCCYNNHWYQWLLIQQGLQFIFFNIFFILSCLHFHVNFTITFSTHRFLLRFLMRSRWTESQFRKNWHSFNIKSSNLRTCFKNLSH